MRRSVTLVSVAITTFALMIVATVVYGYTVYASPQPQPLLPAPPDTEPSPESIAALSARNHRASHEEAVSIASGYLHRTDAYTVELVEYNGQQAYKVTFLSGDVVYVSLYGQVLGVEPAAVQMVSNTRQVKERERGGGHDDGDDDHAEVEHEDGTGG